MSTPPAHLSGRTLLPGALLAVLVTCAGLFALGVVIAVGPDGPVRLWLDGGGSATNLRGNADAAFPNGPVSLLPGGSVSGPTGEVRLGSPVARTDRPGAVRLRANTRVERRSAARTPAATRPNRTAPPASTPSPLQPASRPSTPTTPKTTAPVASPAPGSTVVKSREQPSSPTTTEVPKERMAPAAAPQSTSSPEAAAPQPQRVQPTAPQDTVVGVDDGVLHRVPTP